jgi:pyruvate-ferredoxin/flavodoxin oxidoreductase
VQTASPATHNFNKGTVKGVQFNKPYFEFSGACAGCGETPYVKLVSQLFGDSMLVANATGCSSIYGGSAPSNPYTIDKDGHGPSWANSLFEDNAEFGFGMRLAVDYQRTEAYERLTKIATTNAGALADAINALIAVKDTAESHAKTAAVLDLLKKTPSTPEVDAAIKTIDQLPKKSAWIVGGDG